MHSQEIGILNKPVSKRSLVESRFEKTRLSTDPAIPWLLAGWPLALGELLPGKTYFELELLGAPSRWHIQTSAAARLTESFCPCIFAQNDE